MTVTLTQLNDAYNSKVQLIDGGHDLAARSVAGFNRLAATIHANGDLSPQGKRARLTGASEAARTEVKGHLDQTGEAIQDLREMANGARQAADKDAQTQLLEEMRMGRAWDRYKPMLDAGILTDAVIRMAGDDPVALAALRRELPAYFKAADPQATDREHAAALKAANASLDAAGEPHLSELERRAKEIQKECDQRQYLLDMADGQARSALAGESVPVMVASAPVASQAGVYELENTN